VKGNSTNIEFDLDHFTCYFTDEDIEIFIESNRFITRADYIIPASRIYFKYFDDENNLYSTRDEINKILTIVYHLNECYTDMVFILEYRIIPMTNYSIRDYNFPHYV